MFNDGFLKAVD